MGEDTKTAPKKVLVESPFKGNRERNLCYARACLKDCFQRNEAPFASHLLYTQEGILEDDIPEERRIGIEAGLLWGKEAEKTVVYIDLGITSGMSYGIIRALSENRPIEIRGLPAWRGQHLPEHEELLTVLSSAIVLLKDKIKRFLSLIKDILKDFFRLLVIC